MPDPARLTDEEAQKYAHLWRWQLEARLAAAEKGRDAYQDGWRERDAKLLALELRLAELEKELADYRINDREAVRDEEALEVRLAAAENVVETARSVWIRTGSIELREALFAYDAQKEPTGNHAESSTTRGDTNE